MSITMVAPIQLERLTKGEVHNLAGHDRGLAARELFQIDELDGEEGSIEVIFPTGFREVSSSFFQGMFSKSVQQFGSVAGFFEHYHFAAPTHVRARIADYAQQVLSRRDY